MTDLWRPEEFQIGKLYGDEDVVEMCAGYVYRGLGLFIEKFGSPKGHRPPQWSVTHLGTGHKVCSIMGTVANAFPLATELAELSDWDFDGLNGWVNRDPELKNKVKEFAERNPKQVLIGIGPSSSEVTARKITMARS